MIYFSLNSFSPANDAIEWLIIDSLSSSSGKKPLKKANPVEVARKQGNK